MERVRQSSAAKNRTPTFSGQNTLTSSQIASVLQSPQLPAIKEPLSPLKGFADEHLFKLLLFDVGILGALAGIDPGILYQFSFGMFKG